MLVAITSDIHNNLVNLKKVLDYCNSKKTRPVKSSLKRGVKQFNGVKKMICCGDLASLETLDFLNDNFSGEIFYCFGNMDDGQMKMKMLKNSSSPLQFKKGARIISPFGKGGLKGDLKNVQQAHKLCKYKHTVIFKNYGEIKIADKAIAFVHYPDKAKKLAESGKYEFVFYGHTHKPWEETVGKCKMLNPGNVAGEIYLPTFAVWNTENNKFELIRIHSLT